MNAPTSLKTRNRLLALAVASCFSAGAWALPVAPTVVGGSASFSQNGNVLNVKNSNGAIINWQSFSIGAGETTRFLQSSASSSVLNRVLAGDPSLIYGTLSSNGRVWLVNPAGILVGAGGRIDTAGFVASTLAVKNSDFLANKLTFGSGDVVPSGTVVNQGTITTPQGGSVYLVGAGVENDGLIQTPRGTTLLAAGKTVQLIDTATPGVKVELTGDGQSTNLGQVVADAGRIGLVGSLVKNSGTLNASSVVKDGGRVFLKASQDAYVDGDGRIVTTGVKGGRVEVLGDRVALAGNAAIDAS
ncbi:MAG TPA: filamentous hemagglutinin N-terminal domain-containing protein, partial [Rhodocyclaceae bacterium]